MNRRLYVGNLSFSVTSEQLREVFSAHGEVVEATAITDRVTGRAKGFGFVEMATEEGAQAAIQNLNETAVAGRNIVVNEAREREANPKFGYGGGRRR